MIYALKFGASLLLPPGIFILIMFGVAGWLWRKNERKPALAIVTVNLLFYLLSTWWIAGMMIVSLEDKYSRPDNLEGDCIIMLGGGAMAGTPALVGNGTLSCGAESRLALAAQLYHQKPLPIIVSGGQVYSDSGNEAQIAKREFSFLGIPEKDVIIEDKSLNTRQNAIYTAQIMQEKGFKKPILVTSAFHMERSVLNFQKEGIEPIPFPTDFRTNQPRNFHLNKLEPSPSALESSTLFFREKLRSFVTRYIE